MSLSPFDSFQSRFVTYLLNRHRTIWRKIEMAVKQFSSFSCVHTSDGRTDGGLEWFY